jgi:hypothetical protein
MLLLVICHPECNEGSQGKQAYPKYVTVGGARIFGVAASFADKPKVLASREAARILRNLHIGSVMIYMYMETIFTVIPCEQCNKVHVV